MSSQTIGLLHKSLVQTIVENIEERIVKGELKPGQRLREESMCKILDVSRSPLREAFRILENQGFLVNKARKGVFVSSLSRKEAVDIYVIRAALESLATYLAVKKGNKDLAQELREIHQKMVKSVEHEDWESYLKYNFMSHEVLISSCENNFLIEILRRFHKQTSRYRSMILAVPGKTVESIKRHEQLIQSIEEGDALRAEKIRKESILDNIVLVEKIFKDNDNGEEGDMNEDRPCQMRGV